MKISITDFNRNISAYIDRSKIEPIKLTKRGMTVAVIVSKKEYEKRADKN